MNCSGCNKVYDYPMDIFPHGGRPLCDSCYEEISKKQREQAQRELEGMLPDALKAVKAALRNPRLRNAQSLLKAATMIFDRSGLPAVGRTEISGGTHNKITIEIVRPLEAADGEISRQARIPARTIDAA